MALFKLIFYDSVLSKKCITFGLQKSNYLPMNASKLTFLVFCTLFLVFLGCKKEETGPNSPQEFLQYKVWDGNRWTYTYTLRGLTLIDSNKTISDVRVTFSNDGNYSANPPFRFMRANGKWKLSEDGKTLTLDNDPAKGLYQIESLDLKTLRLKQSIKSKDPILGSEVIEVSTISLSRTE